MSTSSEKQDRSKAHDKFVREIFGNINHVRNLLKVWLPEDLSRKTDFSYFKPLPTSMVSAALGGTEAVADLLFETRFSGHVGLLYFLLEHKSYPDKFTPLQAHVYQACAWWQYHRNHPGKSLPLIYTLVLHHGKHSYHYDTDIRALIDAPRELVDAYVLKPFQLVDLSVIPDAVLTSQGPEDLQLIEWILKHIADKDLLEKLSGPIDTLMSAVVQKDKQLAFSLLQYVISASGINSDQFKRYIAQTITPLSPELGGFVMNVESQWMQKGVKQGLQQGVKQGSYKARQEMALALLVLGIDEMIIIKTTGFSRQELLLLKQQMPTEVG